MENLNQNQISIMGPPIKICPMFCFQSTILSKLTCESGIPWHLDVGAKGHSSCIHTLIKPFAKTFFLQNSQQAHLHWVSSPHILIGLEQVRMDKERETKREAGGFHH